MRSGGLFALGAGGREFKSLYPSGFDSRPVAHSTIEILGKYPVGSIPTPGTDLKSCEGSIPSLKSFTLPRYRSPIHSNLPTEVLLLLSNSPLAFLSLTETLASG